MNTVIHKTKFLLVLGILYIILYRLYQSERTILLLRKSIGNKKIELYSDKQYFLKYWDLQRTMRLDYNRIIAPCKGKMKWKPYYEDRTPYTLTSAKNSKVILYIKEVGQYSRAIIQTYSIMKTRKRTGGDSWRVFVKGVSSVFVTTIDQMDGTYEMSFLILLPGSYFIELFLEYTACDGYKDPPEDFFAKGNDQGKGQERSALPGYERPYLEERFPSNISFFVKKGKRNIYEELKSDLATREHQSCLMWDGFGQWSNDLEWTPFLKEPFMKRSKQKTSRKKGILWIYGDSVGDFFYRSIRNTPLCNFVFFTCNRTYNWVYNLPNGKPARGNELPYTGKNFNLTRLLDELDAVLIRSNMNDLDNVLLLNYGLHFVMSISLDAFVKMMYRVVQLIQRRNIQKNVVWKTTTAMQKWKYGTPESNARHALSRRFLTEPRVELFEAVASSILCESKMKILDVFPISHTYPNGTGWMHKPWDAVHYQRTAFIPVEEYLYRYFEVT